MRWYLMAFKNYVNFKDRARRTEYWMFTLVNALIMVPLVIAAVATLSAGQSTAALVLAVILIVYSLATFLPSWALIVRRLHDQEKSAGWLSLYFISLICNLLVRVGSGGLFFALIGLTASIWMLVLMCLDGTYGPNYYGDDPRQSSDASSGNGRAEAVYGTDMNVQNAAQARITGLMLSKPEAGVDETVMAQISYDNTGSAGSECAVTLSVDGARKWNRQVLVPTNKSGTVSVPVSFSKAGEYTVKAGNISRQVLIM